MTLRLEPSNFQFVAQHLNHPSYRVRPNILFHSKKNSADGTNSNRTAIVKLVTIITIDRILKDEYQNTLHVAYNLLIKEIVRGLFSFAPILVVK
jgi:hypothetical protein